MIVSSQSRKQKNHNHCGALTTLPPCTSNSFFFEKLAILKSVLKCSAGNSASVHFFVQGPGRTRQHLALGLTNARLLSYQYTFREEQEHSSTLAERLLKNMVWVGGKASSGGLLADTPSPTYKRPHIQLKLDPPVHSVLNGIHKILLVSAFEFVLVLFFSEGVVSKLFWPRSLPWA